MLESPAWMKSSGDRKLFNLACPFKDSGTSTADPSFCGEARKYDNSVLVEVLLPICRYVPGDNIKGAAERVVIIRSR